MTDEVALSCIIPAFNEAPRIGAVIEVASRTPAIGEIVVVDDGSTDGTAEIVAALADSDPQLRLIRQPRNGGKARAVRTGVDHARGRHVLLLDSDLTGLTPRDLEGLIAPVATGRADAAISLRRNAPKLWHLIGIDYISGERIMPRRILADHRDEMDRLPGFGLEVWMNRLWIARGLSIAVVHWPRVSSPMKHAKHGALAGLWADVLMLRDMFRTVSPITAAAQILTLRTRRV